MFLTLWNFIRGYVIIDIKGFSSARFLNLAVHKNIYIWNIHPSKNAIRANVSLKAFRMLKPCAKKTNCRIKIVEKRGVPFWLFKHKKRKAFVLGILIFIFAIYTMSSFIWLIEIEGNNRIDTEKIMKFCEERNLKIGSSKLSIDTKALEKEFKNSFTDISWISINIKGTKAVIRLTETLPPITVSEDKTPCNIVASADGIITEISTKKGTPLVKAKDVVSKGDVLVSGELTIKEDETGVIKEYTHAQADIKAKLWHKLEVSVPLMYTEKKYTDNIKKDYSFIVSGKNINIIKPKIKFKNFDKFVSRKQLSAGENYALPIIIATDIYKEYEYVEKKRTIEEAKKEAEKLINDKILETFSIDTDIIDKTIEFKEDKKSLKATAIITVVQNIGLYEPLN